MCVTPVYWGHTKAVQNLCPESCGCLCLNPIAQLDNGGPRVMACAAFKYDMNVTLIHIGDIQLDYVSM